VELFIIKQHLSTLSTGNCTYPITCVNIDFACNVDVTTIVIINMYNRRRDMFFLYVGGIKILTWMWILLRVHFTVWYTALRRK